MSTFQKTHSNFSYTLESQACFQGGPKKDILQKFMKTMVFRILPLASKCKATNSLLSWTFFSDGGLESGQFQGMFLHLPCCSCCWPRLALLGSIWASDKKGSRKFRGLRRRVKGETVDGAEIPKKQPFGCIKPCK